MNTTSLASIPASFFRTLATEAIPTLERAASICHAQAAAAAPGSRTRTMWLNRRAAVVAEISDRGFGWIL
jgi:hypothetical protein